MLQYTERGGYLINPRKRTVTFSFVVSQDRYTESRGVTFCVAHGSWRGLVATTILIKKVDSILYCVML